MVVVTDNEFIKNVIMSSRDPFPRTVENDNFTLPVSLLTDEIK